MNLKQRNNIYKINSIDSPQKLNFTETSLQLYYNRFDYRISFGHDFLLNYRNYSPNTLSNGISEFLGGDTMNYQIDLRNNRFGDHNVELTKEEKQYLLDLNNRGTIRNFIYTEFDFLKKLFLYTFYINKNGKANYSSGGGLYPIYPLLIRKENNNNKLYGFKKNKLFYIKNLDSDFEMNISSHGLTNIQFYIILCYDFKQNFIKYNDLGVYMAIYEVGSINNLLQQNSKKLNLGLCELGNFNKIGLERNLGIDGLDNHIMSVTAGGKYDL